MIKRGLIALIFMVQNLFALDTYKYIAYAEKFVGNPDMVAFTKDSKGAGDKALDEFGYMDKDQPSENTQYIVVKNTDVVILEITFKDQDEVDVYNKLQSDERLFLFEISGVLTEYNEKGEFITTVKRTFRDKIPVDLNFDWSVVKSSIGVNSK